MNSLLAPEHTYYKYFPVRFWKVIILIIWGFEVLLYKLRGCFARKRKIFLTGWIEVLVYFTVFGRGNRAFYRVAMGLQIAYSFEMIMNIIIFVPIAGILYSIRTRQPVLIGGSILLLKGTL